MAEGVLGHLPFVLFSQLDLLFRHKFLVLFKVSFDVSELLQEFVVHQDLYVLNVVVSLVSSLELPLGFSWVHPLKD